MNRTLAAAVILAALLGACTRNEAPTAPATGDAALATDEEKALYALGLTVGRNLGQFQLSEAELKIVQRGLADTVGGRTPQLQAEEWGPKIMELARSRIAAASGAEKERGKAFAEQAAKEPGAEKTASGMVYRPLKAGQGASPSATDIVKVHYVGTLIGGEKFDSSRDRGEPAQFPLNAVVPCWTEGVQKMKIGGSARLVCPSDTAYGDRGSPPRIPGGATLVFEVELIDIVARK